MEEMIELKENEEDEEDNRLSVKEFRNNNLEILKEMITNQIPQQNELKKVENVIDEDDHVNKKKKLKMHQFIIWLSLVIFMCLVFLIFFFGCHDQIFSEFSWCNSLYFWAFTSFAIFVQSIIVFFFPFSTPNEKQENFEKKIKISLFIIFLFYLLQILYNLPIDHIFFYNSKRWLIAFSIYATNAYFIFSVIHFFYIFFPKEGKEEEDDQKEIKEEKIKLEINIKSNENQVLLVSIIFFGLSLIFSLTVLFKEKFAPEQNLIGQQFFCYFFQVSLTFFSTSLFIYVIYFRTQPKAVKKFAFSTIFITYFLIQIVVFQLPFSHPYYLCGKDWVDFFCALSINLLIIVSIVENLNVMEL